MIYLILHQPDMLFKGLSHFFNYLKYYKKVFKPIALI